MRVGEGDLATTPHTTDADLALDPSLLGGIPRLDDALVSAGFVPKIGASGPVVGSWVTEQLVAGSVVNIDLDLLVPGAVSGKGKRAARLAAQGDRLARKAVGLELALIDGDIMNVAALDSDPRSFEVRVAGVAALLVAKAHKVEERLDDPKRSDFIAKDALDMLRLLRGSDLRSVANVLSQGRSVPTDEHHGETRIAIAEVVSQAMAILRSDFAAENARGCVLAGRAAAGRDDPAIVSASLAALVNQLLELA